jgi:hypothetical protein
LILLGLYIFQKQSPRPFLGPWGIFYDFIVNPKL